MSAERLLWFGLRPSYPPAVSVDKRRVPVRAGSVLIRWRGRGPCGLDRVAVELHEMPIPPVLPTLPILVPPPETRAENCAANRLPVGHPWLLPSDLPPIANQRGTFRPLFSFQILRRRP